MVYMGSKARIAKELLKIMNDDILSVEQVYV